LVFQVPSFLQIFLPNRCMHFLPLPYALHAPQGEQYLNKYILLPYLVTNNTIYRYLIKAFFTKLLFIQ
jgi:hypothetical protein